mmetsp:Transcript_82325/g.214550  ORF Transcript_82325/g.214550 Transcript_82325/m.214550 type:complete len:172 (+) Transcript_82325:213-728(+)
MASPVAHGTAKWLGQRVIRAIRALVRKAAALPEDSAPSAILASVGVEAAEIKLAASAIASAALPVLVLGMADREVAVHGMRVVEEVVVYKMRSQVAAGAAKWLGRRVVQAILASVGEAAQGIPGDSALSTLLASVGVEVVEIKLEAAAIASAVSPALVLGIADQDAAAHGM